MKLHLATGNAHKISEFAEILGGIEVTADNPGDVEENASDFAGNALIKVRAIAARHPGEWCAADDSGLEVRALGGAPGVRSARYAGEPSDSAANNALLLANLEGEKDRRANFTCTIALVDPSGVEHVVAGKCHGTIAEKPSAGVNGFGYDPLFIPDGETLSFAEMAPENKNAISHRGRALAEARRTIEEYEAGAPGAKRQTGGTRFKAWLRLFRAVNLPTVPGDVLAGAAAAACAAGGDGAGAATAGAALAAVFTYMYGLADNDLCGAGTDSGRPIPEGAISVRAARRARSACCIATAAAGAAFRLPVFWWLSSFALLAAAILYNRTKRPALMGACRALNVMCGFAAALPAASWRNPPAAAQCIPALALAAAWFAYFTALTRFSEGEETDPAKKKTVGFLVGGVVWLQIFALVALSFIYPGTADTRPLLVAAGVLLVALRLFSRFMPDVSAS